MSECFLWGDGPGFGKFVCPEKPGKYLHHMVAYFTRQAAMIIIALGLLLNGAFPCCAEMNMAGRARIPAGMSMTMPGMSMQQAAIHSANNKSPAKSTPRNSTGTCCVSCTCAIPILASQDGLSIQLYHYGDGWVARDMSRDGLAIIPSLPPPIA